SSRRRHTRLVSDWSSDVCSSDLCRPGPARAPATKPPGSRERETRRKRSEWHVPPLASRDRPPAPGTEVEAPNRDLSPRRPAGPRSEERRVGKEGRSRREREQ